MSGLITAVEFGPVVTTPWNFEPRLSTTNGTKGLCGASFSGVLTIAQAKTLLGVVRNPDARITRAGVSGVQAYVTSDSVALSEFNGYYLLQTFDFIPDKKGADARYAGFSLTGVLLGDLE